MDCGWDLFNATTRNWGKTRLVHHSELLQRTDRQYIKVHAGLVGVPHSGLYDINDGWAGLGWAGDLSPAWMGPAACLSDAGLSVPSCCAWGGYEAIRRPLPKSVPHPHGPASAG